MTTPIQTTDFVVLQFDKEVSMATPLYPTISATNVEGNHWHMTFDHEFTNEINFEVQFQYPGALYPDPEILCFQDMLTKILRKRSYPYY